MGEKGLGRCGALRKYVAPVFLRCRLTRGAAEGEAEERARAGSTFDGEGAAVVLDDGPADIEAQAEAAGPVQGQIGLVVTLEDLFGLVGPHARSLVADLHAQRAAIAPDPHAHQA